jgi:hypothetical protein
MPWLLPCHGRYLTVSLDLPLPCTTLAPCFAVTLFLPWQLPLHFFDPLPTLSSSCQFLPSFALDFALP